jgi:hypothetical protein
VRLINTRNWHVNEAEAFEARGQAFEANRHWSIAGRLNAEIARLERDIAGAQASESSR